MQEAERNIRPPPPTGSTRSRGSGLTGLAPRCKVDANNTASDCAATQEDIIDHRVPWVQLRPAFGHTGALATTCLFIGHCDCATGGAHCCIGTRNRTNLGRPQDQRLAAVEIINAADGGDDELGYGGEHVVVAAAGDQLTSWTDRQGKLMKESHIRLD